MRKSSPRSSSSGPGSPDSSGETVGRPASSTSALARPHLCRRPSRLASQAILAGAALALAGLVGTGACRSAECTPGGEPARVAAVLDGLDLALDDGRELRLAGLDPVRATDARPRAAEDARQRLSARLSGQAIRVLALAAADRWDRVAALAWFDPSNDATAGASSSVAEVAIGEGLGRARPERTANSCYGVLLRAEHAARAGGLGLWADPYYAVLAADDREGLARRTGAMAVVEGRLRVGAARSGTYLRLGREPGGFAAWVSRRAAKALAAAGLDTERLAGHRVRVRGFLDDRFGPRIEVTVADQIELVDDGASAAGAAAPNR